MVCVYKPHLQVLFLPAGMNQFIHINSQQSSLHLHIIPPIHPISYPSICHPLFASSQSHPIPFLLVPLFSPTLADPSIAPNKLSPTPYRTYLPSGKPLLKPLGHSKVFYNICKKSIKSCNFKACLEI